MFVQNFMTQRKTTFRLALFKLVYLVLKRLNQKVTRQLSTNRSHVMHILSTKKHDTNFKEPVWLAINQQTKAQQTQVPASSVSEVP
jgi:hypothetical protein